MIALCIVQPGSASEINAPLARREWSRAQHRAGSLLCLMRSTVLAVVVIVPKHVLLRFVTFSGLLT